MNPHRRLVAVLCAVLACSASADRSAGDPPSAAEGVQFAGVSGQPSGDLSARFKAAVRRASPGVVSVYSTKTVTFGPGTIPMDPFDFFFDLPPSHPREFKQRGLGSGFIFDKSGHILTNNHVVEASDEIRVKLSTGREYPATVVGLDPPTDLAVLKIDAAQAKDVQPLELGDSDKLEVADWVLAIGDPMGLSQTVSAGIVSAVGRGNVGITDYEDFIQTDAAVNPGNSGGPLIDLQGRVVGINTAIASRTGGSNGIAFAVPVNMAKRVVAQLLESGKVTRAHLGVVISDLSEELAKSFGYQKDAGVLIQDVVEEGPAAKAGLKAGDIVIAMNGEPVQDASKFRAQIADAKPGADVQLDVWRNNKSESITVRLAELPTEPTPPPPATRTSENVGIAIDDITPSLQRQLELPVSQGAIIVHVEPASAAQQAGLQPGDIIERVGTRSVETAAEAVEALRSADLQAGVRLRIRRGDSGLFVFVRVK